MQETILIVYLVVAIALVGIILLQQGKGAEMGASFGAGGANTVFGAAGSGNALTKGTTILAIVFFATALGISYLNSTPESIVDEIYDDTPIEKTSVESELPAAESAAPGVESELPPVENAIETAEAATSEVATQAEDSAVKTEDAVKQEIEEEKTDNN